MPEDTLTRRESEDLIDVSDVSSHFEEETPQGSVKTKKSKPASYENRRPGLMDNPRKALISERFTAKAIDAILLYILYWPLMLAYRTIALENTAGPIPAAGLHGIIFHALFLFVLFLYFFVFESIFYATPGKMMCGLSIRTLNGNYPSISACLLRNLLLPVDLILFPLLIPMALMEWTQNGTRIGDIIARTFVFYPPRERREQYSITFEMLPSASGRTLAFFIDLLVFLLFTVGYALILSPEKPVLSMLLLVYYPLAAIIFFMIPEFLSKTSLGKWIFGYSICTEDGFSVGFVGAFIRTVFRAFDTNPFGFFSIAFSTRHQRPGDSAASTIVCKMKRKWNSLITIGLLISAVVAVSYAGVINRNNFLSPSFKINFLPAIEIDKGAVSSKTSAYGILSVGQFKFAEGDPENERKPAIFKPGEKVFIVFSINGGKEVDDKVWLQEDLIVRYPDGTTGLKLENLIDFNEKLPKKSPVEMTNNIALPPDAVPGRYTVSIIIRDKNSDRQLNEQRFFYVSPKDDMTIEKTGQTNAE